MMKCRFVLKTPIGEFFSEPAEYRNHADVVRQMKRLGTLEQWLNRVERETEDGWVTL